MFGGLLSRGPTAVADVSASVAPVGGKAGAQGGGGGRRGSASSSAGGGGGGCGSTAAAALSPPPTHAEVCRALQLIRDHPQMTDLDKQNVVSVLAQAPRFAAQVAAAPAALLPPGYRREREAQQQQRAGGSPASSSSSASGPPAWEQYMSLKGIVACSQKPVPPEKVYKIRGVGEVEGEPEVIYHFMSSVDAVREWDPLLRRGDVLRRDPHPALPVLESGFDVMLYGVPGFSLVFSERQFLVRVMGLELPDRTRVIAIYSLPDGHQPPRDVRDVGVPPRAVRAHMSVTGAVISPLVPLAPHQQQHYQQQHLHHHGRMQSSSGGGGGGGGGGGSPGGGRRASGSHGHGRHHRHSAASSASSSPTHRHNQHHNNSQQPSFTSSSSTTSLPLPPQRCEVTLLVQVDPRGGVPPSVVNACALTMPANLQRVRASVARASATRGGTLLAEQRAARAAALASARRLYHDAARAFGPFGSAAGLAASNGGAGAAAAVAAALSATLCLTNGGGSNSKEGREGVASAEPRRSLLAE